MNESSSPTNYRAIVDQSPVRSRPRCKYNYEEWQVINLALQYAAVWFDAGEFGGIPWSPPTFKTPALAQLFAEEFENFKKRYAVAKKWE